MALHITLTTKSVKVQPRKIDKLRKIIEQELEYQGPDTDLNFIDISCIDNFSSLPAMFSELEVGNIKIDQWYIPFNVETCDLFTTIVDLYSPSEGYSRKVCGYM